MSLQDDVNLLFVLRQAKDAIEKRLEYLKIRVENGIKTQELPTMIQDELGMAQLETRCASGTYEVKQLALRDAIVSGQITYDDLFEADCISFKPAELWKNFPEFVNKQENDNKSLVVRLAKISQDDLVSVLCQLPKNWRELEDEND